LCMERFGVAADWRRAILRGEWDTL